MAYCAASCNQEPVQAIVAQVVSLYSVSCDCRDSWHLALVPSPDVSEYASPVETYQRSY